MGPRKVALVNRSSASIAFSHLAEVAHALQTQTDRDFGPVWGVRAQVVPLHRNDPVPAGVWPMSIVDRPVGGLGIQLDKSHRPFVQAKATSDWTITASHELLEVLGDPLGHKFVQGPDIDPRSAGHLVSYLVAVADPCEISSYSIAGVASADFVTPEYGNRHAAGGRPSAPSGASPSRTRCRSVAPSPGRTLRIGSGTRRPPMARSLARNPAFIPRGTRGTTGTPPSALTSGRCATTCRGC